MAILISRRLLRLSRQLALFITKSGTTLGIYYINHSYEKLAEILEVLLGKADIVSKLLVITYLYCNLHVEILKNMTIKKFTDFV
jgi:uncharacterized membrane protein